MRRLGRALIGAVLGGALAVGLGVAAAWLFDISQAEGAYAMAVAFFWMPLGVAGGAAVGALT